MIKSVNFSSSVNTILHPLILVFIVLSTTLYVSAYHRAGKHWESAEFLLEKGDLSRAVLHYQWAARAYYPGSMVGQQALQCLWDLAQKARRSGQKKAALHYLSLQRGAIRASTWLFNPYKQWVEPVDQAILELYITELKISEQQEIVHASLKSDLRLDSSQSINIIFSLIALVLSLRYLMTLGLNHQLKATSHTQKAVFFLFCSLTMLHWALAL